MVKKILGVLMLGFFLWGMVNTIQAEEKRIIRCAGCKTEKELVELLAKAFTEKTGIELDVKGGGNKVALPALLRGEIDIADCCMPVEKYKEILATYNWQDCVETIYARDPAAIVVHKDNPVHDLTRQQLQDIFTGEIENWKDVGGPDMKIIPMSIILGSGFGTAFRESVCGQGENAKEFSPNVLIRDHPKTIKNEISYLPGGIGGITVNLIDDTVKAIKIDGYEATAENIVAGNYKVFQTYRFVTVGEPQEIVKQFIDFCVSEEGKKIMQDNGYTPLPIEVKKYKD